MAIQFRRGAFADFIKSKMVAGEPAVVQSGDTSTQNGKAFYICYTPGSVDRVLTEQDKTALDSQISDIEDDLAAAEQAIENVQQSIPAVDATLTTTGAAADAKKTGDEIADLKSDIEQIVPGLSEEAKVALLNCFAHVKWSDGHGQDYYDVLEEALYATPVINPFENAEYGIGGWAFNINPNSRTNVTFRNELENRASSVVPLRCSSGRLVAKTGYNINAHFLTGLTYGTWTYEVDGTTKDGYLDGLYTDTTHYQWDTEKTIPNEARYVCVTVKKTDNTNFATSEVATLYGIAFEYEEVSE